MKIAEPRSPDERFDLPILDPAFKAGAHHFYAGLRAQGEAVVPIRLPTGLEAWLVIGHEAARELLNDSRLSKRAPSGRAAPAHALFQHLLTVDPPEHTRLRSIIAREFSLRRVTLMRPRIHELVVELIEDAYSSEAVDLMSSFALPLPLRVICELVGLPRGDDARVLHWSRRLAAADLDTPEDVPGIADDVQGYLCGVAAGKRRAPDDSLLTSLVAIADRGEISETELTAMAFLLLSAGHETTANLIGNGLLALLQNPAQWSRLCASPQLAPQAVEELLRYDSPLEVSTLRFATSDIQVGRVRICAGDTVFIGLAAANRDPERYAGAGELDIARQQVSAHLAFGHGVHFCAGAALARAEAEIAFIELARRFPRLALDVPVDELEWTPGFIMRGLRRLPIRFNAAPSRYP